MPGREPDDAHGRRRHREDGHDGHDERGGALARGEAALDPAIQHHVLAAVNAPAAASDAPDDLTPREIEVLTLIAEGLTNAEIAGALVVSAATVKSHVNHIFAKIGARDRAQAVVYAYANGLAQGRG